MNATPACDDAPAYRPAGFWRRLLAALCDVLLLATATIVLLSEILAAVSLAEHYGWVALDAVPLREYVLFWAVLGLSWSIISFLAMPALYFTICEGAFGQTLGKCLFSLLVVCADGRPIGYGRAFARLLTLPYAIVPAGLGFLWAALPPSKRAWNDYISATRVVTLA